MLRCGCILYYRMDIAGMVLSDRVLYKLFIPIKIIYNISNHLQILLGRLLVTASAVKYNHLFFQELPVLTRKNLVVA